jgi:hypothetical protein
MEPNGFGTTERCDDFYAGARLPDSVFFATCPVLVFGQARLALVSLIGLVRA